MKTQNNYDDYNREERALCSHLFRLLHENLHLGKNSPLGSFVKIIFENGERKWRKEFEAINFTNIGIYSEVAIIRDAYYNNKKEKSDVNEFLDNIVKEVMKQESITECRLYSMLKSPLNNPEKTHPKQISYKAKNLNIKLTKEESTVYEIVQELFNVKPDLLITIDDFMLICEAKFTQKFSSPQIERTKKIGIIWANLLYKDLGFKSKPKYVVFKLGPKTEPHTINWEQVSEIANVTYSEFDRSRICIAKAVELLRKAKE